MPLSNFKLPMNDTKVHPVQSPISAFLGKLWKMVEDPKTNDLICWGESGNSFVIKNQIEFTRLILPSYYKHNNMASFIRQLNMYGFHKVLSTTSGTMESTDDEIEFTHPNFIRGRSYLLQHIKRKMNMREPIPKSSGGNLNDSIKRVLTDVKTLKGKQENMDHQLIAVKQENEILWRELSVLRQKHTAQQNILNKLIRFLVSLAQPNNHGIIKRRLLPLMLKDANGPKLKQEPYYQENDHVYTLRRNIPTASPGPTIHEIHPSEILDDVQIFEAPYVEVGDSHAIIDASPKSNTTDDYAGSISPAPSPSLIRVVPKSIRDGDRVRTIYVPAEDEEDDEVSAAAHLRVPSQLSEEARETPGSSIASSPRWAQPRSPDEYIIPESVEDEMMFIPDTDKYTELADSVVSDPVPPKTKEKACLDVNDFFIDLGNKSPTLQQVDKGTAGSSLLLSERQTSSAAVRSPANTRSQANVRSLVNTRSPAKVPSPVNLTSPASVASNKDAPIDLSEILYVDIDEMEGDRVLPDVSPTSGMKNMADNIQNMEIACQPETAHGGSSPGTQYEHLSKQLDTMASDINSLKQLFHNEGFTLDVNTLLGLFNEDPLNYNVPAQNSEEFSRSYDSKIEGNELVSSSNSLLDFSDVLSMRSDCDWSQPGTPLSTIDHDVDLNTPQIRQTHIDDQPLFTPPPSKKIRSDTDELVSSDLPTRTQKSQVKNADYCSILLLTAAIVFLHHAGIEIVIYFRDFN